MNKLSPKIFRLDTGLLVLLAAGLLLFLAACGYNTPAGGGGLTPFIVVVTPTPVPAVRTAQAQFSLPPTLTSTMRPLSTTSMPTTAGDNPPLTPTPELVGDVYTVQKGDTLFGIAHKFGVDVRAIIRLNNIADADTLHIGQKLQIPSPQSQTPTPGA